MVTDGIMKIVWDIQKEIREKIKKLGHEYDNGDIHEKDYTSLLQILEAKMSVLDEIEDKLGNYEE